MPKHNQREIAILGFTGIGIDDALLQKLSDQSQIATANTLSQDQYLIMTRENMLQILDEMNKDLSCFPELVK